MNQSFDNIIIRKGTSCVKHDMMNRDFGTNDLLPMWVADMDLPTPSFIVDAIKERCNHHVFGYTYGGKQYFNAIVDWLDKRYNIAAQKHELHYIPGIVAGIAFALQAFTQVGDKVIITTPVYPPFIHLPLNGKRTLVTSKLYIDNGKFNIDFADLEEKIKGCKMMILSNPHNPGGTIWSKEDLEKIANLCKANNCILISDEIHADLVLEQGQRNISFSTVSETAKDISITFVAPSKTFNIPGLASSVAYIPNDELRNTFFNYIDGYELANGNVFAYIGAQAAFSPQGEEWLENKLKPYLRNNLQYMADFLQENMPKVKFIMPQASFLVWLDFSDYNLPHSQVKDLLINNAKVALNDGTDFGGDDYKCCFRLNVGCPKETLKQALQAICNAFEK